MHAPPHDHKNKGMTSGRYLRDNSKLFLKLFWGQILVVEISHCLFPRLWLTTRCGGAWLVNSLEGAVHGLIPFIGFRISHGLNEFNGFESVKFVQFVAYFPIFTSSARNALVFVS